MLLLPDHGLQYILILCGASRCYLPETLQELIDHGFLVPPQSYVIDVGVQGELANVRKLASDFDPGEVENVILQHPAVFECAVIGLPDEIKDESIVGVVVLHPDNKATEKDAK